MRARLVSSPDAKSEASTLTTRCVRGDVVTWLCLLVRRRKVESNLEKRKIEKEKDYWQWKRNKPKGEGRDRIREIKRNREESRTNRMKEVGKKIKRKKRLRISRKKGNKMKIKRTKRLRISRKKRK
jgi:hypothetical protein